MIGGILPKVRVGHSNRGITVDSTAIVVGNDVAVENNWHITAPI